MRNAEVIRQWKILKRIEAGRYTTAQDLADIMDRAGYVPDERTGGLVYEVPDQGESSNLSFQAVLPTGASFCFDCG